MGPALAGMVIMNLESSLVSLLTAELSLWKRYFDDTKLEQSKVYLY